MKTNRTIATRSSLLVSVLASAALMAAACGSSSDGATEASAGGTSSSTIVDSAVETTPPPTEEPADAVVSGAQVRVVNLFAADDVEPETIVVVPGLRAAEDPEPVQAVGFGEASDWFEPPAPLGDVAFSLYPEGAYAEGDRLMPVEQQIVAGDRVTIILTATEGSEGTAGAAQFLFEALGDDSNGAAQAIDEAPAGQALVIGNAHAVEELGDGFGGVRYGVPGQGCLEPADGNDILVGGTANVPFALPAGTTEVTAYAAEDAACTTPVMDAVTVDLAEDERTYVFVHGTAGTAPELLVLPTGR